jgi:hypothetical protein
MPPNLSSPYKIVDTCLPAINASISSIKVEIKQHLHVKEQYQCDLASDMIYRKYRHLSPDVSPSDKLERENHIDRNLKYTSNATARRNLFTLLTFDMKGFIDPYSIKRNTLTRVDVKINNQVSPLMTKNKIKYHLLKRNPQACWAAGSTPFGHTDLGRAPRPTGYSPLTESILDGSFSHTDHAINDFT